MPRAPVGAKKGIEKWRNIHYCGKVSKQTNEVIIIISKVSKDIPVPGHGGP
jgi:hypothetical protein